MNKKDVKLYFQPNDNYDKSIAVFDKHSYGFLKEALIRDEKNHNLNMLYEEGIYSPNSHDYLYLYNTVRTIREKYNISHNINVLNEHFTNKDFNNIEVNSKKKQQEIPYIHLKIGQAPTLGARSNLLKNNNIKEEIYYIEFDYEFLRRYIKFLMECFDALYNSEEKNFQERCFIITFKDKRDADNKINELSKCGEASIDYGDGIKLKIIALEGQGKNNKFMVGKVPAIYTKQGFSQFCTDFENLIAQIIDNSVNVLIAHEMAHIGNGHILMKSKQLDYFSDPYVQQMLEFDADTTALMWVLGSDFMDGVNGIFDTRLDITLNDLKESLTLKILSYYILLRWTSIKENSIWDKNVIKEYYSSENIPQHPPFQLRCLQMLNNAFNRLDELLEKCLIDQITTKDNKKISKDIIISIKEDILQMIVNFEDVFGLNENDTGINDMPKMILNFKEIINETKDDMNKAFKLWPEISEILKNYSYCKINNYI